MSFLSDSINGKRVTVCVTGGIAAYKALYLASSLRKNGADVHVVMTKNACEFVNPLSFRTITKNKVTVGMFDNPDFVPHISLSDMTDLLIVAPATANIIAKFASGIADCMVSTLFLSTKAAKIVVPAMNTNMFENEITQENINKLRRMGVMFVDPEVGELACGISGSGRYPKNEVIEGFISSNYNTKESYFTGKSVLITAGGTIENIDPVRYICNRSSGKTAFYLAEGMLRHGSKVKIIYGNVSDLILSKFNDKYPFVELIKSESAESMLSEINNNIKSADILIMAAAVADYKTDPSENKIKKSDANFSIQLKKNPDILSELKENRDLVKIGFAAETENLLENGKSKLEKKSVDFIIANNVKGDKSAMGTDNNELFIINRWDNDIKNIDFGSKITNTMKLIDVLSEKIECNQGSSKT